MCKSSMPICPGSPAVCVIVCCRVRRYETLGCVVNIGMKQPSTQIVKCVRADMVRSTSGVSKPAARLPAYRGRKVLTAWISDERLSTFMASIDDRAPMRDSFKQLALLHRHDENVSEEVITQPKVFSPSFPAMCTHC